MHDLVIRGGLIVDGTGGAPFAGDVAVTDGVITAVGPEVSGDATEVIDATGLVVTPGFVDIHTHYDGQVSWDEVLEPSASHGVTTVVTGNCGVGFAPVRPGDQEWLVELMEGVEDIPGTALYEGITWEWESFPEYLDTVRRRHFGMDVAAMVAHAPLRVYVMGQRGVDNEPATPDDIATMAELVGDAVRAGAIGFSTGRTMLHKTKGGELVPGTFAQADELRAIALAIAEAGGGLYEVIPADHTSAEDAITAEIDLLADVSRESGLEVSVPILQNLLSPTMWRTQLDAIDAARASGAHVSAQVASRPFGMLIGLASYHAFQLRPTYRRLADELEFDDLVRELQRPEVREQILGEDNLPADRTKQMDGLGTTLPMLLDRVYVLGDPPDYEPTPEQSVAALAAAAGIDPMAYLYDAMVAGDGRGYLLFPFLNYNDGDHEVLAEMLTHPGTVLGLSDGGAHCRLICDASLPTYLLTHWVRDRSRGERLPIEMVVHKQTAETAAAVGLTDRGTLEVGKKADLNVIDFERLTLEPPRPVDDLPAGGRRVLQDASGYVATIVSGVVTRRDDTDTGARPGRLVGRTA